jgi:hypothetical protein
LLVCIGFLVAGILINASYIEWQKSPVSTTITTHPLSALPFPTVTVCPPKGSNTALNYDLMTARNVTLTADDREDLKKTVVDIFSKKAHKTSIDLMMTVANPGNMLTMYKGYQSVPKPYSTSGFEVSMWDSNGKIESPGFGGEFDEERFKADKELLYVLDFPWNLADLLGSGGSLVVDVEVDTREQEGLEEWVEYREGSMLELYTEKKTWEDAEAHCQAMG